MDEPGADGNEVRVAVKYSNIIELAPCSSAEDEEDGELAAAIALSLSEEYGASGE